MIPYLTFQIIKKDHSSLQMTYLKGNTQFRISAERKRIKFHHFDKSVEVPFPVQDVQARVFKIYQLGQTSNSQKLARFSFYKMFLVKKIYVLKIQY